MLNIAGIFNKQKNVLGLMPHPERAIDIYTGSDDGLPMFENLLKNFN
jgi:phosphoribosylformylglycinamidine synthase